MMRKAATRDSGHPERRPSKTSASGKLFLKRLPFAASPDSRRSGWPPFWLAAIFFMILGSALLGGCANVKPWERESFALPGMQIDPEPLISGCDDHIYFSREASKGGRSYGGGGCGCN